MKISFQDLVLKASSICRENGVDEQAVYALVYALSSKVKNLNNYVSHRFEIIDFDLVIFHEFLEKYAIQKISLARLLQFTYFCNELIYVLPKVFIPKHETELLVHETIKLIQEQNIKQANYIDLCTGTGAIGLTLKKFIPELNTSLLDIDADAILCAKQNQQLFKVSLKIIQADWEKFLTSKSDFQIITANFPYVNITDEIEANVVLNEPSLALFASENGWYHYERFLTFLKINLQWKIVVLETNHNHQIKWLKVQEDYSYLWKIHLTYDLNNLLRVVSFQRL